MRILVRAVGALLLIGACAAVPATAGQPAPSRVLATADETPAYSLVLSRQRVAPGPSIIQFANAGEDAHNLEIKRVGGTRSRSIGALDPGQTTNLSIGHLRKNAKYKLWCTLPLHAQWGMKAYLNTKKHH